MSLTYGANSSLSIQFAKVRIVGVKDEDRDLITLKDKQPAAKDFLQDENKFDDFSSFAVFDGHGGKKAADVCELKLNSAISKSYIDSAAMLSIITDYPDANKIRNDDIVDTLFVKAIHDGVAAVHEASIRESETAGTTLCSLFLVPIEHQKQMHDILQSSTAPATAEPWQPPQADVAVAELGLTNTTDCGRSYKVMCANVGDSRCVMVGCSAEPVKVSRKGASLSGGTSSNNLGASMHSQPTFSLYRSAKSIGSFSSTNLSAMSEENKGNSTPVYAPRSIWTMQTSTDSDSSGTGALPNVSSRNSFLDRFKRYLKDYSRSDEDGLSSSSHLDSTVHTAFPVADDQMEEELPAAGTTVQVSVRAVTLCEDHKPSSKRERFRVEQRVKIGQQVLPVPVRAFEQKDEDFVQLYTHRYFGQTKSTLKSPEDSPSSRRRPEAFIREEDTLEEPSNLSCLYSSVDSLRKPPAESSTTTNELWSRFTNQLLIDFGSTIFGSNIKTPFLCRLYEATKLLQRLLGGKEPLERSGDHQVAAQNALRMESCFQLRKGSDGASGPEAYFPRFSNNSLLMTRSIGDKNGPRGCLPRADITAVTVHATQHARFVLASDGVWDVVDEELIRKVAMYYKYKDPRDLAVYLAEKAVKRRTKQGLSKDDITLFVIDVNPHNAVFIKTAESKDGDHYYPAYHMTAAKKWTPMKSSVLSSTVPTATLSPKKVSPSGENVIPITTIDIADYSNNAKCNQS